MNSVERVKEICKERKIAISKLEKDLGYANGYIGQLRKGVFPSDRLKNIADYLNISVEYLMTGKKNSDAELNTYETFENLCNNKGITPYRVCKETGITTATISNWKAGRYTPKAEKMQKIADYFGISIEYLMTGNESATTEQKLNSKDEKDIARVLDETLEQLDSDTGLMFDGDALDPETKELLKISLENAIRTAKITAKKKFTPNKYKKPDNQ